MIDEVNILKLDKPYITDIIQENVKKPLEISLENRTYTRLHKFNHPISKALQ